MRKSVTLAALAAAALVLGGRVTYALDDQSGWFYTPSDATQPTESTALPQFNFASATSNGFATGGTTFAFNSTSAFGAISLSGHSHLTVPHLLSGGLISRDGPGYSVRDLEFVDRLSGDSAISLGYNGDAAETFDLSDVRANPAYGGIFSSIAGFESGLGISELHAGASIGLGDGLSLNFGEQLFDTNGLVSSAYPFQALPFDTAMGFDQREAETSLAGIGWKFAPWGSFGLTASHSGARSGSFGEMGELSLAKSATNALGATGQIAFGGGWVTSFSYNEGITQLDLRPPGASLATESLHDRSYGLAIAKHGLFGDDALGIAVSRPLDQGVGSFDFGGAATADPFDGFISSSTRPILSGATQPTDVELGYVTTFMDGALALQANAGYQMNAAGQPGNNSLAVLSRAKINF